MLIKKRPKHQDGQSLIEYALVLILLATLVIVVIGAFGPKIGEIYSDITDSVSGMEIAENETDLEKVESNDEISTIPEVVSRVSFDTVMVITLLTGIITIVVFVKIAPALLKRFLKGL